MHLLTDTRVVDFLEQPWCEATYQVPPEHAAAIIAENGEEAYRRWEADRGIATFERVN